MHHAPLIGAEAAHTLLSIDDGVKNLGFAVVRDVPCTVFEGGASRLTAVAVLGEGRRLELGVASGRLPNVTRVVDMTRVGEAVGEALPTGARAL